MSVACGGDAVVHEYPIRLRRQGMAVRKVNSAIKALEWPEVMKRPRGDPVRVCEATQDEWEAFVGAEEEQELKSTHMEWVNGTIFIVELPSEIHDNAAGEILLNIFAIPGVSGYLDHHGAAYVATERRYEPDQSFGPDAETMPPLGAVLPTDLTEWHDFHTLKVEIGVSRLWGDYHGQLDWKANQWATFPGVEYILCIAIDTGHQSISYKLYDVDALTRDRLPRQDPVPVVAPSAIVHFDSHRLLGLPSAAALPPGFPDPDLVVDLFVALRKTRLRLV